MTDQTMIERVARAAAMSIAEQDDRDTDGLNPNLTIDYLDQGQVDFAKVARAIISAMREPTEAMCLGMVAQDGDWGCENDLIWKGMIDAALAEE